MTVELITGYSGTPHIGSDDVQHLLAGIVGGGSYALDTGKKLAIAVNSANSVTIDTGDAIIAGGAHVRVAAAEKLTVTSGAQGVKRNDLVCLRYTKASDNKESAALVVVKGTATSGTPADPAVNTGSIIDGKATVDMPLYRLPLDGVSLGTPVKLFNVSPTLASLGDSVSRDDPITLYGDPNDKTSHVVIQRIGNTCTLKWGVRQPTSDYLIVDKPIPEKLQPANDMYVPACATNGSGYVLNTCAYCFISAHDGFVGFQVADNTGEAINRGFYSWPIG